MKKIINEQLNISCNNPLKIRPYDYKYFTYPWHLHVEYEMIYVEHGSGQCLIGDNILDFKDHTLFLFGSSLPHWMQSCDEYKLENDLHVNGTIIQFEKDFMRYSFSNYIQFMHIQKELDASSRGCRYDLNDHPDLQHHLMEITKAEGIDQIILLLEILKGLVVVENKTLAASPGYNITLAGYTDNKIEKVLGFINTRYTQDLTLEQVATFAAMNPSAFCRYFKEKTGKTLTDYILDLRIGFACQLLAADRLNVSQVSIECGFDSLSYFNRIFKKKKGYTPTQFKRMLEVNI